MIAMQYLVVIEKSDNGFGAYVPDLPGCVAAAETRDEVLTLIHEAILLHIESLQASGNDIPPPKSRGHVVDIQAA